jgi:hypothetical protein
MWLLSHLTAGHRDEALGGDLLEVYRLGRSDAWYWRQVLIACAVSWVRSLQERLSLLVFALIWCGLAPAWTMIVDRIQTHSHQFGQVWKLDWPFSILAEFTTWMGLDVIFIWAGILIYVLVQPRAIGPMRKTLVRPFALAPVLLIPAYFATFVLMNLLAYPGMVIDRRTVSAIGEITDLRLWADAVRIPFLIALVGALWGVASKPRIAGQFIEPESPGKSEQGDSPSVATTLDDYTLRRTFSITVFAGLVNAMIAAVILCRLPSAQARDLGAICGTAVSYVLVGALAGVAGSWLYWHSPSSPLRNESPLPFSLFALTCAAGWVWVPAMVLFAEQVSAATALAAMIGAFMLAPGLHNATKLVLAPNQPPLPEWSTGQLFAESLYSPPLEIRGYVIAIGLFASGAAMLNHSNYTAAALLAMSAFLFAWEKATNAVVVPTSRNRNPQTKRAAIRVLLAALPAVLLTMWALLDSMTPHGRGAAVSAAVSDGASANEHAKRKPKSSASTTGTGGYESVVLWPYPEKKEIVPPIDLEDSLLAPGTNKPFTIRFNGSYWFLQPPLQQPGREAHIAHGTPVSVDLKSNNSLELVMDAHQNLPSSIRTERCREIQVEIENLDNRAGIISLGVLLKDDRSSPQRTLYLGPQPIASTEPEHFFVKMSPAFETLHFSVPSNASMRRFNQITVLFLPDIEHTFVAPKISILQFDLLPR